MSEDKFMELLCQHFVESAKEYAQKMKDDGIITRIGFQRIDSYRIISLLPSRNIFVLEGEFDLVEHGFRYSGTTEECGELWLFDLD